MNEPGTSADAFDHIGARYDDEFTNTELSRWFRARVWERLGVMFKPGDRVIDWAAAQARMPSGWRSAASACWRPTAVRPCSKRHAPKPPPESADLIETRRLDFTEAAQWDLPAQTFDGAYSNYGALNCVGDWQAVGGQMARAIQPGGQVGLGVMGRWCPWEVIWHGLHGDFRTATRRWRKSTIAHLDGNYFTVYYPTPGRLQRDFGTNFRRARLWGFGVFLPPSDLYQPVGRRRWLARPLLALERLTAPHWPFNYLGDHYWLELERI